MHLTETQQHLYNSIDEILWKDWDPIGVNNTEDARDEYQNYTPQIFSLRINGGTTEDIAQRLFGIEKEYMGVIGNIENCKRIADKIMAAE